jgi:tetratricopeptide (TPR) repeat protein
MTVISRPLLTAHALAMSLAFTSTGQAAEWDTPQATPTLQGQSQRPSLLLATKALEAIRTGQYADASRTLNAALKFDPENAYLHFLNGLSYHLLYSQGAQASRELAETAYNLSLRFAPDHALSSFYLGLLHLEARQYVKAQAAFAHALLLERDDPSSLQALAMASYYARDLGMAQWAIQRLEEIQVAGVDNLKAALRSAALIYAAAGRFDDAFKRADQYRAMAGQDAGEQVRKRVRQWQSFHESNPGRLVRTASQTIPLAPESPSEPEPALAPTAPPPPVAAPDPAPGPSGSDAVRNWSDCPQNTTPANSSPYSPFSSSGDTTSFKDETTPLPALPAPCDRKSLPRMVLLDTAIISTYESITSSKGINLLDGLRIFLANSFLISQGNTRTKNYSRMGMLDNTANDANTTGFLSYSLNIANSGNEWNQVLARPTLVSLDRQPSTFFSGTSLATTIPPAANSYSPSGGFVEHPAGISLSATPTFIDDESLLLSVRVARSYFPNSTDLRNETIVKSRNSVSANVLIKMGETLILSGLTERQSDNSKRGVPVLQDIPVLQYLFSTETKQEFTQSVLVMITPRLPATGSNAPLNGREKATDPRQAASLKELREQIPPSLRPVPNLDTVFMDMEDNRFFREFRAGDLRAQDWRRPPFLERTLKQIAEFLYY